MISNRMRASLLVQAEEAQPSLAKRAAQTLSPSNAADSKKPK